MKVLSIGNSFSQDAHRWLHQAAQSAGESLTCVNLFYPGCSLARHAEYLASGEAAYEYEVNGEPTGKKVSLREGVTGGEWDVITLQQVSGSSGIPETYQPYLNILLDFVRESAPGARLLWHETWSYEIGSTHKDFSQYGCDQRKMFEAIVRAAKSAANIIGCGIIPAGEVIQALRETVPALDYAHGGLSLNRDGFHLSYGYGRYAAALTWLYALTGKPPSSVSFVPRGEETDQALLAQIRAAAERFLSERSTTWNIASCRA